MLWVLGYHALWTFLFVTWLAFGTSADPVVVYQKWAIVMGIIFLILLVSNLFPNEET